MERNFLMSVSHELRTPLTAIRGHVAALLEGVVEDPEMAQQSLETVEAEAQRLERLVGDILDLAKLDTHRFTVTTEEVDMAQLLDQAYERYREEASRRSIDFREEVTARPGDRLGRRPRAAGRRQPPLERVPRDARRRPHLARARAAERNGARRGRGQRPRHPGRGSASASSVRSSRSRAAAPASASRSRRSCLPRSADASSSSRRSGGARGSSWCCRPKPRRRRGSARRSPGSARAASMRSRRAFSERQPSVSSSTSSARSSTRAVRSASSVDSIRSSRRIALFERPFTSARRREIGAASSRRPSRSASRTSSMAPDASVRVGWNRGSSTTTCRPS